MAKKILFWTIAMLITIAASIYQRSTGPTYSKKLNFSLNGKRYSTKLPRSGGEEDCEILIKNLDKDVKAYVYYRRYPSNEEYTKLKMETSEKGISTFLPLQPPAGKLEYYIAINDKKYFIDNPLIIRFKGDIPSWALIPHILFMFLSMLLGCYALLLTLNKKENYKKYIKLTTITLFIGGFIFGPIVQYNAFGQAWTGFPYGYDLTDNKTLIAFIFLLIAYLTKEKRYNRIISFISIIILFVIFSIPHSFKGSELDYNTGQVTTSKEYNN